MLPKLRTLLAAAVAMLPLLLVTSPAQGATSPDAELLEARLRESLRQQTARGERVALPQTEGRVPPGSTLAIAGGDGQALVTGVPSAPLVVRVTGPEGSPLAEVPVVWEILSPPGGIVDVAGTDVPAVQLASQTTFTDGAGTASNRVTILLPIPATIRASVPGSSLTATFQLSAGLQNIGSLDPNARAVGAAIDIVCPALVGELNRAIAEDRQLPPRQADLLGRCSDMVFGTADQPAVDRALKEVTTEETAASGSLAIEVPTGQMDNVRSRLTALRAGVRGVSVRGLSLGFGSETVRGDWVQPLFDLATVRAQAGGDDPLLGEAGGRLGLFLNGHVTVGEKDATALETGFDFDAYGITGGIDYRVRDSTVMGIAAGYDLSEADFAGDEGNLEVDALSLSGYLTAYSTNGVYFDAVVTYGESSYDLQRRIDYTLPGFGGGGPVHVNQIASADPDGDQISGSLEVGWDLAKGRMTFAPFLRGSYADVSVDGYEESMSDPAGVGSGLALAVDSQHWESVLGVVGFDLAWSLSGDWGVFVPQLRGEWTRQFEDETDPITARFLFDPTSTAFTVFTDPQDQDYVRAGAGVSAVFPRGVNLFLFYDTLLGLEDFESHSLSFGVRIER